MRIIKNAVLVIFLFLVVSIISGCSEKVEEKIENKDVKTYSNFGFSFEYPTYMTGFEELGLLEEKATDASGSISAFKSSLSEDYSDDIAVGWFKNMLYQESDLEEDIKAAIDELYFIVKEDFGNLAKVEMVGGLVEGKKDGNKLLYQLYTINSENEKREGVVGTWYSQKLKRAYILAVSKEGAGALELFEKILKSFKED